MKAIPLYKFLYDQPFGKNREEVWFNLLEIYNMEFSGGLVYLLFENGSEVLEYIGDGNLNDISDFINLAYNVYPGELKWDGNLVKRNFNFML